MLTLLQQTSSGIPWSKIIQIGVMVLFLSGGFLRWLLQEMAKRSAEKARQQAVRAKQDDMLRTGRFGAGGEGMAMSQTATLSPSDEEVQRRLREVVERQRAIAAARGRPGGQQSGRPGGSGGARGAPMSPPTQRSGPVVRSPDPRARPVVVPNRTPQVSQPGRGGVPAKKPQKKKAQPQYVEAVPQRKVAAVVDAVAQARADEAANWSEGLGTASTRGPGWDIAGARPSLLSVLKLGPGANAAETRRALVLSEVFGRPLSMRDE